MTRVASLDLSGKTILYLVTEDWYFWSHRLPFARAARDAGAKVIVACPIIATASLKRDLSPATFLLTGQA